MAATVKNADQDNDTKKIASTMDQLGKDLGAVEKSIAKIRKLQATITKKPDECADNCKALYAELNTCVGLVDGFASLPKALGKAVFK